MTDVLTRESLTAVPTSVHDRTDATIDQELPCQRVGVADLFFSERPADLEEAKTMCADCPLRAACLEGALERAEPWGVWGGNIFDGGRIIAVKRGRGRPRKNAA